jgi:hypothetical protein
MLSDKMLLDIQSRYSHYGDNLKPNTAVNDIRLLLEEIKRLKQCYEDCYNGVYNC